MRDAVAAQLTGVRRAQLHADLAQVHAAEAGEVASQDAIDGVEHAWRAGSEVEPEVALQLLNRAGADAWARSAYRDVAELDRRALEACTRMPAGSARFDHEVDLQMQLVSVEAVVNGQSSALDLHSQGGRRIFSPLYLGLLCDAEAVYRDVGSAQATLARAETLASATGERVWDAQLSARRLRLSARLRMQGDLQGR